MKKIIIKSAIFGLLTGVFVNFIIFFFEKPLFLNGFFESISFFLFKPLFVYGMISDIVPILLVILTFIIYGIIIGILVILIKNKSMKKLFIKKNLIENIAAIFLALSFLSYILFTLSCECLGCLFIFGLMGLFLFISFVFIIISFIRNKFITKNIILGVILFIMVIAMFSQISIRSHLSDIWQEFNLSDRCLDSGGAWNYEGNYCEIMKSIENGCEIMQAEVPLWNSSGYKIIIPYRLCDDNKDYDNEISFSLENGESLILHDKNGDNKIMEFSKIAPETVETTISFMAYGEDSLQKGCSVKKVDAPNRWVISSSESDQIYCGPYSQPYDDSITRYFTVLNDFVVAFIDIPEYSYIDFQSVDVVRID